MVPVEYQESNQSVVEERNLDRHEKADPRPDQQFLPGMEVVQ